MRISFFKGLAKIAGIVLVFAATISLSACSGDNGSDGINGADGKDGKNGKDAKEVNVDSLASAIRDENHRHPVGFPLRRTLRRHRLQDSLRQRLF